jgi:hypothetical protein
VAISELGGQISVFERRVSQESASFRPLFKRPGVNIADESNSHQSFLNPRFGSILSIAG